MTRVQDLLACKTNQQVFTIGPNDTVFEAMRQMAIKNVASLLVVERDDLIGIITERDYARKIVLKGRDSRKTEVSEVMSTDVMYVLPNDNVAGCMALMTEKRVRHLPVLENGKLIGLVSIGDVVQKLVRDQQFLIDQLVRYVHGPLNENDIDDHPLIGSPPQVTERPLGTAKVANMA